MIQLSDDVPLCHLVTWRSWVLWVAYNLFVWSCGFYVGKRWKR